MERAGSKANLVPGIDRRRLTLKYVLILRRIYEWRLSEPRQFKPARQQRPTSNRESITQHQPLYPFGHGLSYAKFGYSPVKLSQPSIAAGATLGVDVTVRNESAVVGDEVAQLYLHFPDAPGMPVRALRGFRRITLAPG